MCMCMMRDPANFPRSARHEPFGSVSSYRTALQKPSMLLRQSLRSLRSAPSTTVLNKRLFAAMSQPGSSESGGPVEQAIRQKVRARSRHPTRRNSADAFLCCSLSKSLEAISRYTMTPTSTSTTKQWPAAHLPRRTSVWSSSPTSSRAADRSSATAW